MLPKGLAMPIAFSLADSSELGQRTVLTVRGALDAGTTRELEQWLASLSTQSRGVVVDLSGVTAVSESCVEAIAQAGQRLTARGQSLRAIVRDDRIAQAFAAGGLTDIVQRDRRGRLRD